MTKSERLRLAYESKLGKDLVSKLSDAQIKKLSEYYNSLPPEEQSNVDSDIIKGGGEFMDIARGMAGMMEVELGGDSKFTPNAQQKPEGPMRPPSVKGGDVYSRRASDSEISGENIPKGLDDLLNSIRGESGGNKSGALAVYVPDQREEDLVSEQIDERILTLLGLEDAIDIDYATYKTLLREKMMAGRMSDSEMPSEEVELLTNEFKRVKGNTGRFRVKKEKINFQSFVNDVKPEETEEQSIPQESLLALPGTAEVKQEPKVEEGEEKEDKIDGIQKFLGGISDRLAEIEKNLSDMLDMDAKELADEKKDADKERVVGEKQKKRDKESKLESGIKGIGSKITEQVTKPVKSLFDSIINFFTQIFLGNLVKKLIEFINDPLLIFNPLIGMINGVIDVVNNVLEFMFGGLVENINKMIEPLNGGLTNLENTVNSIFGIFGEQEEEDKIKLPRIPEAEVFQFQPIEKFKPKEEKKEESIKGMAGGGLVTNEILTSNTKQNEILTSNTKQNESPTSNTKQNEILTSNTKQEVGGYKEGDQITNLNFGNIGGSKSDDMTISPKVKSGDMTISPKVKSGDMTISPKVSGFKGGGEIKPIYKFLSPITAYSGGGSVINNNSNNSNTSNNSNNYSNNSNTSSLISSFSNGGSVINNNSNNSNTSSLISSFSNGGSVINNNSNNSNNSNTSSLISSFSNGGSVINNNSNTSNTNLGYTGGGSVINNNSNTSNTNLGYTGGGSVINNNSNTSNTSNNYSNNSNTSNTNLGYTGGGSVFNNNSNNSNTSNNYSNNSNTSNNYSNNSNTSNTNLGYTGGGSVVNTSTSSSPLNISNFGYTGGGSINSSSGQTITGMGPDTQLIAAQPGEIVMSNKAVQTYGANNLLAMNRDAGGTNVPTMGTIQGFSGGGVVQPVPSGSYKGQSGQKYGDPRNYGGHAGIDITENPPYGQDPKVPVVSMADGKVAPSSPNYPYQTSGYTSNLTVNHGNGLMATYLHMKPDLKVGSSVKRGQKIGNLIPLGSASNSFAQTHLHLQTYKDGEVVNPLNVLNGTVQPGSGSGSAAEVEPSPSEGSPAFKINRRGRRVAVVKPSSKSAPSISPPPQKGGQTSVLPVPGSNQQQPPTSSVSAGQKDVPSFSSRDMGNTEFIVIKSIYNIAG